VIDGTGIHRSRGGVLPTAGRRKGCIPQRGDGIGMGIKPFIAGQPVGVGSKALIAGPGHVPD